MRLPLIALIVLLTTGCIQEAQWTWTGDTPGGDAAADQVTGDGKGEVSPSDVPGGKDTDVDAPKDTTDTVEPLDTADTVDACIPDCDGKDCGNDGCGGLCGECELGQVCLAGDCGDSFTPIPNGVFWMGSPGGEDCPPGYKGAGCDQDGAETTIAEPGRTPDREVLHQVTLNYSFEMQVHEVTQDEWVGAFDGWNPSQSNLGLGFPVEMVSWHEACAYANWRSLADGNSPCYEFSDVQCEQADNPVDGTDALFCMDAAHAGINGATVTLVGDIPKPQECDGYRLPTEAEWEYAARSGTLTAFYNGQESDEGHLECEVPYHLTDIGWYCGNNTPEGTKAIGEKVANAWGIWDQAGNVWEWCWDRTCIDVSGYTIDPDGSDCISENRIRRGGGWKHHAKYGRSACRIYSAPNTRHDDGGFRLVRTLGLCGDDECTTVEDCESCPGDCGCSEGQKCSEGTCIPDTCIPDCQGKECGGDGCGGNCGECPATTCSTGECIEGGCQVDPFYCVVEETCVPSGTENPQEPCQKCQPVVTQLGWSPLEDGYACGAEKRCWQGACCDYGAFCADKECGDDSCGEVCGECAENQVCLDQVCCTPDCTYKQCGGDGCVGICGTCPDGQACEENTCIDPDHVWSKSFGGDAVDVGYAVAVDSAGNVYIAGRYGPPGIHFGDVFVPNIEGQYDAFVAKLDADGDHEWSFGFNGDPFNISLDTVGTQVYLAGVVDTSPGTVNGVIFNGPADANGFLMELNPQGNVVWSKELGSRVSKVVVDAQGNRYLAGSCNCSVDFGGGPVTDSCVIHDAYVVKFDQTDQHVWSTGFGGEGGEQPKALAVDSAGNAFVGGSFNGDEIITFASQTIQKAGGFYDGYLFKVDAQGQPEWVISIGGTDGHEIVQSVTTDIQGNAYITGGSSSTALVVDGITYENSNPGSSDNMFVAKVSSAGTIEWFDTYGEAVGAAIVHDSGQLYLGGRVWPGADLGTGVLQNYGGFIASMDLEGAAIEVKDWYGNSGVKALVIDPTGYILLTGEHYGNVNFGGGMLDSAGIYDVFVTKLLK